MCKNEVTIVIKLQQKFTYMFIVHTQPNFEMSNCFGEHKYTYDYIKRFHAIST